ncbi:hypothetical protein JKP88DRAFT_347022 [Tribonema minus]|uniref:Uncharacterized protein n=1 Tax=Tribonema minus TaxID=303371 RepID=A0A835YLC3_9STRA|nr:hypothetical protein JKP88DRAFT_347022 [Tribonema minus]
MWKRTMGRESLHMLTDTLPSDEAQLFSGTMRAAAAEATLQAKGFTLRETGRSTEKPIVLEGPGVSHDEHVFMAFGKLSGVDVLVKKGAEALGFRVQIEQDLRTGFLDYLRERGLDDEAVSAMRTYWECRNPNTQKQGEWFDTINRFLD